MTARRLEMFFIVSIIGLVGIIYAFTKTPVTHPITQQPEQPAVTQTVTTNQTQTIEYPGVEGRNALDLLKASHRVEFKHYDFGDMVTSIDGVVPDSKHFWAMYVNGKLSEVGASVYLTKSSDTIRWELEEINN